MVDQTGTNNWNMNKPYLITMKFKLIKCSYNAQNKLKIQSNNLYSNINKHTAALQINCLTQHSQCCHYSISINVTSLMRLWLRWSQALLAWSKTIKSQQRQSLFINICFALDRIDWVKVLHPTQHKTGHFRDVLPTQSLSLVRKKLNLTQEKQTTQEQNSKKHTKIKSKSKENPNQESTFKNCSCVCASLCTTVLQHKYSTEQFSVIIFPSSRQSSLLRCCLLEVWVWSQQKSWHMN